MKKLLSILGAISLIATSATTVVSCNNNSSEENGTIKINLETVLTVTDLGDFDEEPTDEILLQRILKNNASVDIRELIIETDTNNKKMVSVKKNSLKYLDTKISLKFTIGLTKAININSLITNTDLGSFYIKINEEDLETKPNDDMIFQRIIDLNKNFNLEYTKNLMLITDDEYVDIFTNSSEKLIGEIRLTFKLKVAKKNLSVVINEIDLGTFREDLTNEEILIELMKKNPIIKANELDDLVVVKTKQGARIEPIKDSEIFEGLINITYKVSGSDPIVKVRLNSVLKETNLGLITTDGRILTSQEILSAIIKIDANKEVNTMEIEVSNIGLKSAIIKVKETSAFYFQDQIIVSFSNLKDLFNTTFFDIKNPEKYSLSHLYDEYRDVIEQEQIYNYLLSNEESFIAKDNNKEELVSFIYKYSLKSLALKIIFFKKNIETIINRAGKLEVVELTLGKKEVVLQELKAWIDQTNEVLNHLKDTYKFNNIQFQEWFNDISGEVVRLQIIQERYNLDNLKPLIIDLETNYISDIKSYEKELDEAEIIEKVIQYLKDSLDLEFDPIFNNDFYVLDQVGNKANIEKYDDTKIKGQKIYFGSEKTNLIFNGKLVVNLRKDFSYLKDKFASSGDSGLSEISRQDINNEIRIKSKGALSSGVDYDIQINWSDSSWWLFFNPRSLLVSGDDFNFEVTSPKIDEEETKFDLGKLNFSEERIIWLENDNDGSTKDNPELSKKKIDKIINFQDFKVVLDTDYVYLSNILTNENNRVIGQKITISAVGSSKFIKGEFEIILQKNFNYLEDKLKKQYNDFDIDYFDLEKIRQSSVEELEYWAPGLVEFDENNEIIYKYYSLEERDVIDKDKNPDWKPEDGTDPIISRYWVLSIPDEGIIAKMDNPILFKPIYIDKTVDLRTIIPEGYVLNLKNKDISIEAIEEALSKIENLNMNEIKISNINDKAKKITIQVIEGSKIYKQGWLTIDYILG